MSNQCMQVTIPAQPGSQYTNEQRIAAVANYYVTGNISKTAEMQNIPRTTLDGWIRSDWGVELLVTIRQEKDGEFDANVTKLIDSAFEEAQDRVENGDYRVSKDGKLIRVPMGGKELVISGATAYDKRQLHRNQPTAIRGDSSTVQALADKFRQLSADHKAIQNSVVSVQEESEEDD